MRAPTPFLSAWACAFVSLLLGCGGISHHGTVAATDPAPEPSGRPDERIAGGLLPQLVLQRGHVGTVDHVSWSSDGRLIATSGSDHSVRIWDADTGTLRAVLEGGAAMITGLTFSPDGTRVAFSRLNGGTLVWDLRTDDRWDVPSAEFTVSDSGSAVAFSTDGTQLVTAGYSHAAVWNLATRERVRTVFTGDDTSGGVGTNVVDPSARWFAVSMRAGRVALASLVTGETTLHETGLSDARVIAFSTDGQRVAISDGGTSGFRLFEIDPWRQVGSTTDLSASLAFSPDGSRVATTGGHGELALWDGATLSQVAAVPAQPFGDYTPLVAFDASGARLMTGGQDALGLRVWSSADASPIWSATASVLMPWVASFSPDGQRVVVGGNGLAGVFRIGEQNGTALMSRGGWLTSVALLPDGRIVTGGADGTVRAWSRDDLRQVGALRHGLGVARLYAWADGAHVVSRSYGADLQMWTSSPFTPTWARDSFPGVSAVAAATRAPRLVIADSSTNALDLLDAETGEVVEQSSGQGGAMFLDIAISSDASVVAAPLVDSVRIWAPGTAAVVRPTRSPHAAIVEGPPIVVIERSEGGLVGYDAEGAVVREIAAPRFPSDGGLPQFVRGLAPSPAGDDVAFITDTCLGTWRVRASGAFTNGELQTFACDAAGRQSVGYSPDGRLLIASRYDHGIEIWNRERRELVATLRGTLGPITDFAVSADGRLLAAVDGTLLLYPLDESGHPSDPMRVVSVDTDAGPSSLALLPDGRFLGNEAAQDAVWYRLGDDLAAGPVVRASDLFFSFFTPDLLNQFWAGAVPSTPSDLGSGVGPPPSISWVGDPAPTSDRVTVHASISSDGVDPSIVLDGMRVPTRVTDGGARTTIEADLWLSPGSHVAEVFAYGARGHVRGRSTPLTLAGPASSRPSVLRALVVTVDAYVDPTLHLDHRGDDGDALAAALESLRGAPFDDIEVVRLRDTTATRAGLLETIGSLSSRTTPEDVFVVYVAAHGVTVACEGAEEGYRVLLHGVSRDPQTRCTESISAAELGSDVFEPVLAGAELLLLDSCESGGALTGSMEAGRAVRNLGYLSGFPVIGAARAGTVAYEYDTLGHGALTFALLEALGGADTARAADGSVTANSLATYLESRVPALSVEHSDARLQRPVVSRGRREFVLRSAR